MGNESSGFHNVTLEEEHRIDSKQSWTLHSATRKDGGSVSVFVYKKDKPFREYVDNAVKNLKVLRHPGIVKFLSLRSTSDSDLLITEHVRPLMEVIDTMTPGEICVGLYSVLEALSFLHEKGRSCHNNICLSSIFVNDDGNWLIGAVEFVCRFEEATNLYLQKCHSMRNQAAITPEEKAGQVEASAVYGAARDAYGFGVLAEQLLEYLVSDTDTGDVDENSSKTFELRVQDECMHPDPRQRPQLSSLLEDKLFKMLLLGSKFGHRPILTRGNGAITTSQYGGRALRTDFVDISNFLKQITLKTEEEKKEFFSGIVERLHSVPVSVLATRLSRPLLARFVLLDPTAEDCLMPHLLTPYTGANRPTYRPSALCCPLLPVSLFRKHVLPELFKIFHVRDAHIRKVLLRYFPCYVEQFDEETLADTIMPQIVLGLRDADDELVAASLHCLGDLVSLIGADTVIGQGRMRIFSLGKPKFASNSKGSSKAEKNGTLPARRSSALKPAAVVESEAVEKKKTLKEIAREAERQKKRDEARQKTRDRQKRREEEKEKIKRIEKKGDKVIPAMSDVTPTPPVQDSQSKASVDDNESETPTQTDSEVDNWEGWDDENGEQSIDSEIDREIEQELVTMGSPPPLTSNTTTPETSFQQTAPNVQVDWSDADTAIPTTPKGRLKLSEKTRTSPPPQSPVASSSDSKSPNRKHVQTLELKKDKTKPLTAKKMSKQSGSNQLGAEFDIKALDIKTSSGVSDEPDFFADMAPVIKKTSGVLDIIEGSSGEKVNNTAKKSSGLAYNVQDTEDAGADGWGDDFGDDWGED